MKKNNTRNLKKSDDYILENLVGKRKIKIQLGGTTTVDLKKTQNELLKTLKNIPTIKDSGHSNNNKSLGKILSSLDNELQKLNNNFTNIKTNKYVSSNEMPELSEFDKFINDISGANINFTYKNDYKINPLLKLNFQNIEKVDLLLKELEETVNFKERAERISLNNVNKLNTDELKKLSNFKERLEKLSLDNIDKLKVNNDLNNFKERIEKISINSIEKMKPDTDIYNFKERIESINLENINNLTPDSNSSLELDASIYENKLNITNDYMFQNFNYTKEFINSIENELTYIEKIVKDLKVRITYFKNEMNPIKIKEEVTKFIKIEKIDILEFETVTGLDHDVKFNEAHLIDKEITIKNNKYSMSNEEIFTNENFLIQSGSGKNLNDFFDIAMKYNELLKKRKIIIELKQVVEEYNLIYIQYYYYQLFIIKNINRFKGENQIYQILNKQSLLTYWNILNKLNDIISKPEDIFSDINSRQRNVHSIFFFRYYHVIKILFVFFNNMKEIWEKNNYDETYKINLYDSKEIAKYIIIFNFSYKILLKYKNEFLQTLKI